MGCTRGDQGLTNEFLGKSCSRGNEKEDDPYPLVVTCTFSIVLCTIANFWQPNNPKQCFFLFFFPSMFCLENDLFSLSIWLPTLNLALWSSEIIQTLIRIWSDLYLVKLLNLLINEYQRTSDDQKDNLLFGKYQKPSQIRLQ